MMTRRACRHSITARAFRLGIFCLLITHAAPPTARADGQDVAEIKPGTSVERKLSGGETQSFRIRLNAGEFLHTVVKQKGIDVMVTLFGPDGRRLTTVESHNGAYGPEPIVVVAEAEGDYRLEVNSPDKKAAAGQVIIRILDQREATPVDRDHVAAERAFAEAEKLHSQRTAVSLRAAIEKYRQALPFFQSSGDRYRQALTLNRIGLAHARSGEFRAAVQFYDEALRLFRAMGDQLLEAQLLNNLGGAFDVLGDAQKALQYYARALTIFRSGGDRLLEALTLNNIGKLHNDLADWQKAIDYYNQSLAISRVIGDRRREALALNNIGVTYNALGEPEKALAYFQQALPLRQAAGDNSGEAITLNNIGSTHARLGEIRKALEYYDRALPLQRIAGNRLGEALTLDVIGVAHSSLGEHEKALTYHRQALDLRRAVEDRRGEAISLGNIGHVHNLLGRPREAVEHQTQALALFRTTGDKQNQARMLQGIARAERDLGNLAAARRQIEASLALVEEVRARVASEQLRASYLATSQSAYQFYIDLLMRLHRLSPSEGHDAAALEVSERARARSLLELLAEARVDIRRGVDAALLARERELTQQLNAKAQRLTQRNAPEQLAALNQEIGALETEYQQVQARVRRDSPHYAAMTQPEPLGLKEIQRQVLDADALLLEYSLGEERSYLWAVTNDSITSYELPARAEIEGAARRLYDLLTARSLSEKDETAPQKRERVARADAQLPEAAWLLSRMILAPAAPRLKGKRNLVVVADGALQYVPFAALPAPRSLESGVWSRESKAENGSQKQSLSDSRLQTPDSRLPLIVEHEVTTLPSASTLAVLRREIAARKPAPAGVAVFADPVFQSGDERVKKGGGQDAERGEEPSAGIEGTRKLEHASETPDVEATRALVVPRLPYTRREAEQILAVAPGSTNLKAFDFAANRAAATSPELSRYAYVHFATHGYLDSGRPGLSALVLSLVDEQGRPQDGFLRANEIYNLNLPAELVVLSACETGLGKEIKGEGLVGLTRGFMYAGAPRVAVSLWSVSDRATSELMAKFYTGVLKDNRRPAEALRRAQIAMWKEKRWAAPYYWAAFTLQGEWR